MTTGLVDSGCSARGFADRELLRSRNIHTLRLPKPRLVLLADGKAAGNITDYAMLDIAVGNHTETCVFFVTTLAADNPIILGLPWLRRHNPTIDWRTLSMTFQSPYCLQHCCPAPCAAITIPSPTREPHDITIPGEPQIRQYQATVEDDVEEAQPSPTTSHSVTMTVDQTLTPGRDHYVTRRVSNDAGIGQETRAKMIANRGTPTQVTKIAKSRRAARRLPKKTPPPLSVPIPKPPDSQASRTERPDLTDIRATTAVNFLQFCKSPGTQCMKVTWAELDALANPPKPERLQLPDLSEADFQKALTGQGSPAASYNQFPGAFHDFLDLCYSRLSNNRISDMDIEKFMRGKPELTTDDIKAKLPEWLHDKLVGFLPQLADKLPPRRAWDHKIELVPGKEPPYQRNRPLSPKELAVVRRWLDDNLTKGFIRESRARCAAPLLLAAKPGGGVRICQDYRSLNAVTIKNRYPLPLIRETLDSLCSAKFYTKLDVIAAFNKLRIAEGHEWKTAFITRFGLFESLVMPFGLCNAPASFQHYINHALYDLLDKICTAYLDDVLVYSQTRKEHRAHVREVVDRLIQAGLQIDIGKCEFETTSTKYLGLIITTDGIRMDPDKVKTIMEWTAPTTLRELQRFLGFANFYRRFIRNFSSICRPLNDALRKNVPWQWGYD